MVPWLHYPRMGLAEVPQVGNLQASVSTAGWQDKLQIFLLPLQEDIVTLTSG